jgi:hypothetical protein
MSVNKTPTSQPYSEMGFAVDLDVLGTAADEKEQNGNRGQSRYRQKPHGGEAGEERADG